MTRIDFMSPSVRSYQHGLNRGMLFVEGLEPAVWSGLTSVQKTNNMGEFRPLYYDGLLYGHANTPSYTPEFQVEAISTPVQFRYCEGKKRMFRGLWVADQEKRMFGFAYQTEGFDNGESYKMLHVVNRARLESSQNSWDTREQDVSIQTQSLTIRTTVDATIVPEDLEDISFSKKAGSYVVIDSRKVSASIFSDIETLIYGLGGSTPVLPSSSYLIDLIE